MQAGKAPVKAIRNGNQPIWRGCHFVLNLFHRATWSGLASAELGNRHSESAWVEKRFTIAVGSNGPGGSARHRRVAVRSGRVSRIGLQQHGRSKTKQRSPRSTSRPSGSSLSKQVAAQQEAPRSCQHRQQQERSRASSAGKGRHGKSSGAGGSRGANSWSRKPAKDFEPMASPYKRCLTTELSRQGAAYRCPEPKAAAGLRFAAAGPWPAGWRQAPPCVAENEHRGDGLVADPWRRCSSTFARRGDSALQC